MANSTQDSEAHFSARAIECGVSNAILRALRANEIKTMAHLAFAIIRPGTEFQESVFDDWVTQVNSGVPPAMGQIAALRRSHCESEIIVTAALKASVESKDETTPKPAPFAGRTSRLNALRTTLVGVDIMGVNEPSHTLLEECCQQFESRCLRYIEPSRCPSRESEIAHSKSNKKLKLDAATLATKRFQPHITCHSVC